MNRSFIETIMGAVVLLVAAMFTYFVYQQRTIVSSGDGYEIHATFDNVTGVGVGSDVRIGGIKVGTVLSASLQKETYRPALTMMLKSDIHVPSDSSAAIVSEGLLGGKYVQLQPGADDAMLKSGEEVQYTQSSVSLEEMIGKFMFSGGGVDGGDDKKNASSKEEPAPSTLE